MGKIKTAVKPSDKGTKGKKNKKPNKKKFNKIKKIDKKLNGSNKRVEANKNANNKKEVPEAKVMKSQKKLKIEAPVEIPIETPANKKVYFGEAGEEMTTAPLESKPKEKKFKQKTDQNGENIEKKWYQLFEEYNTNEFKDIKDSELNALRTLCKSAFDIEFQKQLKNNPSDAKWLETALHKGTSKDRANSGALLVQSNPISNLPALESLITLTKLSNKACTDVIDVVCELFVNSLLPAHRKLIPFQNRGNDWKNLKNDSSMDKSTKDKIYAYWHFENELKENFHAFLLNLQASLQNGKEINKVKGIITASNLLKGCPEKENFLLTVVVNKFGDPDKKVASKATYHLRQILQVHPNMASVMIVETEKLIFRNNVSEQAQHYGIGFLTLVAPVANTEASQRLINICFSFFKIKIEKGDINSKTMQSILNCLRVSIQNINDFNVEQKKLEVATPDVVNTIYRLIYLSNIAIAFQALSLLLQLVLVQDDQHDRFYNALYKKMIDSEIIGANNRISSLYFHILHRAIQQDANVPRAKAFIKRLLQMTLTLPPGKACGALIVVSKILNSRSELINFSSSVFTQTKELTKHAEEKLALSDDQDSDDEENYKDVVLDANGKVVEESKKPTTEKVISSWMHIENVAEKDEKTQVKKQRDNPMTYDAYKRSAAFCGAEHSVYFELALLSRNFHPTVQLFVENILKKTNIGYFGDPLRDFSLTQFLDRFSFKNPKKGTAVEIQKKSTMNNKGYQAKGSRGQSVHLLTEKNCTEDEKFIFEFLKRKRDKLKKAQSAKKEMERDVGSDVSDDEFDAYLDTLGAASDLDKTEKDFDYLSELQPSEISKQDKKKKKKAGAESDDEPELDWDEGSDVGSESGGSVDEESDGDSDGTDESLSLDDGSDDGSDDDSKESGSENSASDSEDDKPKRTKSNSRLLQEKLKEKNLNSLFVAADDFSEILENSAQQSSKNHGTLGEIFNQDQSSVKQMDWEEKRMNGGGFKRKSTFKKGNFKGGAQKKKFKK